MEPFRILYGTGALVAFLSAQLVFYTWSQQRIWEKVLHAVHSTLLMWYVGAGLIGGFGLWDFADNDSVLWLFRWSLGPLLLTYGIRQGIVWRAAWKELHP